VGKAPVSLHEHAISQLTYIRATMERASSFTAVPGLGGVVMGVTALAAAVLAGRQVSAESWLTVWLVEAGLAAIIGGCAVVLKARRSRVSLLAEPGRKFALSFAPPLLAGVLLTLPVFRTGDLCLLAGMWLLLYGASIVAGSSHSVVVVPAMGVSFMVLGGIALGLPPNLRDWPLALGFGGLHIVFGGLIWRKYGG
jgi:hypothetical protein